MKRLPFLILAILLVSHATLFTPAYAHEVTGEGNTYIHMYDDRYEPKDVTIEAGTTVIFENVGENEHWPATNIHPTHTLYPGSDIEKCGTDEEDNLFDACRGLKSGETYSFTFNKGGEWRYHDHIYPNLNGTITVTGSVEGEGDVVKESSEAGILDSLKIFFYKLYLKIFSGQAEKSLARLDLKEIGTDDDALRYWMRIFDPQDMMLELLHDTKGGSVIDCHTQAHHLGRIAFELYGARTFSEGDASCHSGFYHGAMETFLQKKGTNNLAEDIKEICEIFESSFGTFECLHGVGHGIMAYESYDLPSAIEDCKLLNDDFSTSSCYGGVFMENVVAGQGNGALIGHETGWVSDDPHFPCNTLDQANFSARYECYQMQTSWMLTLFSYDFNRVAEECSRSPIDMTHVCFKSLGRDISGNSLRDPQTIVDRCASVVGTSRYFHQQCIEGAVNVIVDFWGEKLDGQATEVCKLLTEDNGKSECYELVASRLPNVFVDIEDRERVCLTFEEDFQHLCQG